MRSYSFSNVPRNLLNRGGLSAASAALIILAIQFTVPSGAAPPAAPDVAPATAPAPAPADPNAAPVPKPGAVPAAPIVLFSGKPDELAQNWVMRGSGQPATWKVQDGVMTASGGDIITRLHFTDFQLHVEFRIPYMPDAHGQARGNSGVYLQGRYEIQVLDSYGIADPGQGDCGAVYSQAAPLVNACKPPLEWQTYDIVFRAPRFDPITHKRTEPGRVTVLQNGVVVQDNQEIQGRTVASMDTDPTQPGPLLLQYHGNPVSYRSVWIRPLPLRGAAHY